MDRIARQLEGLGFATETVGWHACSWQFADYDELAAFAVSLFNLEVADTELAAILDGHWEETETGVQMLIAEWLLTGVRMTVRRETGAALTPRAGFRRSPGRAACGRRRRS